ncbi:hypothetical protein B0J12DRAFT_744323 [Macrophomina phaseolina]|uniref:Uncharacterized protein n=1 Tax=Macrophomina phaseolina TaxID=35725 RepID=A0ABQ8FYM7_9PEZI|nr:hypothetical protein B0J12DRAFT_744323 [Macrophomina phaseolina]
MAPSPALALRPPWEEDEDASTLGHDGDDEYDDAPALDRAPVHPIACMQGAFEESIIEAEEAEQEKVKPKRPGGAKARRQRMLEEEDYNESYNAQWRKKPSAKFHPLWKLVAQISFGVHLLNQQLAKSDEEVSRILKTHVQEVDQFLEKTTEDFELALADIQERINHLKLPLEHVNIFDIMLDDRQFRTSIIEGNEKIEKIVERTARAMNDSLVDVEKGIEATVELSRYLDRIGDSWAEGDEELMGIYMAMCGNSEGWLECLRNLQAKGNELGVALVQLGSILNEMTKRAGVASRRSIAGLAINVTINSKVSIQAELKAAACQPTRLCMGITTRNPTSRRQTSASGTGLVKPGGGSNSPQVTV